MTTLLFPKFKLQTISYESALPFNTLEEAQQKLEELYQYMQSLNTYDFIRREYYPEGHPRANQLHALHYSLRGFIRRIEITENPNPND